MRVKLVFLYIFVMVKVFLSLNLYVDLLFSFCIDDFSFGFILDIYVFIMIIESFEIILIVEVFEVKKGLEVIFSMVFFLVVVGNSKFWRLKFKVSWCLEEVGDVVKSKKLMRILMSLLRLIGMLVNYMLVVSCGFLKIKYFKEVFGNIGIWSNVFYGF